MQFLIQAQWVEQEAEERDVEVSDAEVKKSFEDQKKQAFPKEKDYQKFLKDSGMTEEDILFRVKLDQLQTKLTQKITEDEGKVTDEDIQDYYDKNKKRFAQPERRDLTWSSRRPRPRRTQAKAELEDGESFKAVAKEYSIDDASKAQGGKLPDVAKGQQEKALDEAVFSAEKGELEGPVKTQFGYYVFEVTKSRPPRSSRSSRPRRRSATCSARSASRRRSTTFVKDFREKYKDETDCAEGYEVAECKNAPKEPTRDRPRAGLRRLPRAAGARRAPRSRPRRARPQGAARRRRPQGAAPQAPRRRRRPARRRAEPALRRMPRRALARLDEITRRLRRECPWDREQDERSIVPHTVEEAYELADAAHSRRRRQAARRARRRALPGPLPRAAARGARRRATSRLSPTTAARS